MSTSHGMGMGGRDSTGVKPVLPHLTGPSVSTLSSLEVLSASDYQSRRFSMIKLVDITYSEHLNLCLSLSP